MPDGVAHHKPKSWRAKELETPCWCEAEAGPVSVDDIAAGITWSCGRPECQPPGGTDG
jgi:hypothetical protein